jgi:hypothetical protein
MLTIVPEICSELLESFGVSARPGEASGGVLNAAPAEEAVGTALPLQAVAVMASKVAKGKDVVRIVSFSDGM